MFGTVLYDVFEADEREAVHAAIEDLCSPLDTYGWASVGVYAFYDPESRETGPAGRHLLYIGLARDLSERYAQHAGLISFPANGCKREQIRRWFSQHPRLGFSCFVQSTLAQVDTHRERGKYRRADYDEEYPAGFASNETSGLESAVEVEGQLIEKYRLLHGRRPVWNRMGGSVRGRELAATGTADGLLLLLGGTRDSLFRARRTLRELSEDANASAFEFGPLHWARMETIANAWERRATDRDVFQTLISAPNDENFKGTFFADQINYMMSLGYLDGAPGTS
ncbi:hypothetical protein [Micromonospora sp. WMMD1274]|uniref:hypothetical protein n=1 Tax=Micromonospora sp. WMMD1274 TaxID=3404116 RepID=UPI001075A9EB